MTIANTPHSAQNATGVYGKMAPEPAAEPDVGMVEQLKKGWSEYQKYRNLMKTNQNESGRSLLEGERPWQRPQPPGWLNVPSPPAMAAATPWERKIPGEEEGVQPWEWYLRRGAA